MKRFKFTFSEDVSPEEFLSKPYAVVRFGGSIGQKSKYPLISADGFGDVIETGDHEDVKSKVKSYNRLLTPGEKKYYGMRYKTVKLTPGLVKRVLKTRALYLEQLETNDAEGDQSQVEEKKSFSERKPQDFDEALEIAIDLLIANQKVLTDKEAKELDSFVDKLGYKGVDDWSALSDEHLVDAFSLYWKLAPRTTVGDAILKLLNSDKKSFSESDRKFKFIIS